MYVEIAILIILLFLNAFFAASEIALVSLNDNKVKREAEQGNKKAKRLDDLISKPGIFLATIQLGITLAGFLASAFAAESFAGPLAESLSEMGVAINLETLETISVVAITILLSYFTLVIGELVPKQLALQKARAVADFAVIPLTVLSKISLPFVKFLNFSTNSIVRMLGVDPDAESEKATEEEIRLMVDTGGEKGTIDNSEKQMINNIFDFDDKVVTDIMTHRTEMTALSVETELKEAAQIVNEKGYTRFPVYKENIDTIVGILHAKDLIQFLDEEERVKFELKEMIRKPYFTLEVQPLDTVFRDMKKSNAHIAIVLDEYGGTSGLITIEDIIEEIVGDIASEHGDMDRTEIEEINANEYRMAGTASLHHVENRLGTELPDEDYDTLSGFLIGQLDHIPESSELPIIVKYKNVSFEVTKVSAKRIEEVSVTVASTKRS